MAEKLLAIPEAAERLRIRPRTVRRWLSLRQIEYAKAGKSVRISEIEIQRIISEGTMRRAASRRPNTLEGRAVQTSDVNLLATADAKQSFAHKSNAAPQINAAEQVTNPERSRFPAKTMPSRNPLPKMTNLRLSKREEAAKNNPWRGGTTENLADRTVHVTAEACD
jgi:excisionase family DNA binding protein